MEIKLYNVNIDRIKKIDKLYLVTLEVNRAVENGISEDRNEKYVYYGLMNDYNGMELIGINSRGYYSLEKASE